MIMKTLTIVLFLLATLVVFAEEKAPAPFQDSAIERTMKDGTVQKFDGDQFMIVPRTKKKSVPKVVPTPPPVLVQPIPEDNVETVRVITQEPKKNAVILHGGYGPDGLKHPEPNRV